MVGHIEYVSINSVDIRGIAMGWFSSACSAVNSAVSSVNSNTSDEPETNKEYQKHLKEINNFAVDPKLNKKQAIQKKQLLQAQMKDPLEGIDSIEEIKNILRSN